MTKPFVKWAGGKTQLLPELLKAVPATFAYPPTGTYFEPFVGGGALFWALRDLGWKGSAVLNDANRDLAHTYAAIRDMPDRVIAELQAYARSYTRLGERLYYQARADHTSGLMAARFIFLNKTCFNGLYRVNKKGEFNVPHGSFKTPPMICDEATIRACSKALRLGRPQRAWIFWADFATALLTARKGDLVYFDPPYDPASATSNFTVYTKAGFGLEDQRRLASLIGALKARGVHIILSSADTPTTRKLYPEKHFNIRRIEARRSINSKGTRRGPVGELIIT